MKGRYPILLSGLLLCRNQVSIAQPITPTFKIWSNTKKFPYDSFRENKQADALTQLFHKLLMEKIKKEISKFQFQMRSFYIFPESCVFSFFGATGGESRESVSFLSLSS